MEKPVSLYTLTCSTWCTVQESVLTTTTTVRTPAASWPARPSNVERERQHVLLALPLNDVIQSNRKTMLLVHLFLSIAPLRFVHMGMGIG